MEKIAVSHQQMNLLLMAVEHGYKSHEKGESLEMALSALFQIYEIKKPEAA